MGVLLAILHVLACLILVLVVLLQTGKGADMGAVFGGSSQTIFGSSGAGNFLTRLTTGAAVVFMLTSLSLTYMSSHRVTSSLFDVSLPEPPPIEAPDAGQGGQPAPAEGSGGAVNVAPAGQTGQGSAPAPAAPAEQAGPAAEAGQPQAAAPAAKAQPQAQ